MKENETIKKILLIFEQGKPNIVYDKIYTFDDGPNDIKQITLSFGITEYGNLRNFIRQYINSSGKYKDFFLDYVDRIGRVSLVGDKKFIDTLKQSADDPIMRKCQEDAYESMYIEPALLWSDKNKFTLPLSKLTICDSFLQSGSILNLLRNRFSEKIPLNGGNEKIWVEQYCKARRDWLANHPRKILNKTIYRVNFILNRISLNDWDLEKFPMLINGTTLKA